MASIPPTSRTVIGGVDTHKDLHVAAVIDTDDHEDEVTSGKTNRHRLNRGGHRQLNSALYRVVIVRMRFHQPTIDYVARRTAEAKTKQEIIRCLKRYLTREIYQMIKARTQPASAA